MANLMSDTTESREHQVLSERQEMVATMAAAIREVFISAAENRMSEGVTQAALHALSHAGQ